MGRGHARAEGDELGARRVNSTSSLVQAHFVLMVTSRHPHTTSGVLPTPCRASKRPGACRPQREGGRCKRVRMRVRSFGADSKMRFNSEKRRYGDASILCFIPLPSSLLCGVRCGCARMASRCSACASVRSGRRRGKTRGLVVSPGLALHAFAGCMLSRLALDRPKPADE